MLKELADWLSFQSCLQHQRLQIIAERLKAVTPRHTWRKHLYMTTFINCQIHAGFLLKLQNLIHFTREGSRVGLRNVKADVKLYVDAYEGHSTPASVTAYMCMSRFACAVRSMPFCYRINDSVNAAHKTQNAVM